MSPEQEKWRVNTVEGLFETDLQTLKQWIAEGCVLPTDKVSKGPLGWIEAGRAPGLKAAFAGEVMAAQVPEATPVTQSEILASESTTTTQTPPSNSCYNHPKIVPTYICRVCAATFCDECPRFVSSSVPVCPLCGDLCRSYSEVTTKVARSEFQSSGFGASDFMRAVRYPFQHKAALFFGAFMYALLLLAGFRGSLIAYVIMFGCISHVISQVAWGRLNRSFMPDFSAFSFLDDLVVPCCLGIGITIVTWGPIISLVAVLLFGFANSTPFTPLDQPAAQNTSAPTTDDLSVLTDPNADPNKLAEANEKLDQLRPGAQIAKQAEKSKQNRSDPAAGLRMLMPYIRGGLLVAALFVVGFLWAVFYYPMALAVAGYTQSFASVINPLVGLDTIKRMGATYFKAFGMVLMLQVAALIIALIVALITAPLALPFFGNLPAQFVDGAITFYFNLVIACILGLSLHKCADKLAISVD
ncbi:MAG: hypothetical protein ABR555_04685 [Pyrinomonadaceae bacterium]